MTLHLKKQLFPSFLSTIILLLLMAGCLMPVFAETEVDYKKRPLNVRVDRLERLMSSQKQLELLYRMKQLQEENQQLRSMLEEQLNDMRLLKQQQRELYTDLDRRLSQVEGGAPIAIANTAAKKVTNITRPVTKSSVNKPSTIRPSMTSAVAAAVPVLYPSDKVVTPKKDDLPVVVDKSSIGQARYGVTQRQEVPGLEKGLQKKVLPAKAPQTRNSRVGNKALLQQSAVYKKQAMSKKQRLDEQSIYQNAYDELRARRYSKARESFVGLIKKYPGGHYAHIAQYWIAESSYTQRNYEQAIIDYQLLLDVYPSSPKKAEAELKKAFSFYEQGNKEIARQTLNQLLQNYPDTTEAGQAKRLLKQL